MSDESRRPDMQSFVDTFQCPPSQQVPPPPQKKAKRRRKRHVPPGPAGVWFQSQKHHHQEQEERHSSHSGKDELPAADVSSCPAWMCMQASLQLCTPYLPPYLSVQQRYQQLRPCIPSHYLLIPELQGSLSSHKKLLVLVHASAVQYHEYWTVECKDECGATLQAWMDPEFDEKTHGGLLQMGVVWLLKDLRFMVGETTRQPWLLVSRDNIERAWTPQQASHDFSDLQYVEWMTRRSHLPLQQQQHEEEPSRASDVDDEERQQTERRTNDDEEEEDDSVLISRTSFQVVSPHPSAGRGSSHPSSVQQRPTPHLPAPGRGLSPAAPTHSSGKTTTSIHTEVNHVSAPAGHSNVRRELHRTPSQSVTTDSRQGMRGNQSDRNEESNRVNANMFSEFRSPSSEAASSKSPMRQVSASRENGISTTGNQSRRDHSLTPPNRRDSSTTSTLDTTAPTTTVTTDMFSQFSAPPSVDTTKRNRVSFSQAPNKPPPSNHTHVAIDSASTAQQRTNIAAPKSVERPTENTRPRRSKGTEADNGNNKTPADSNARSAVASDFLSQFTAVSARELTQQKSPTKSPPANKRPKIRKEKKATPIIDEPPSSTQQHSPKSTSSPKLPSKLWQCADTAMLGMFDEEEEEEEDDGMVPSQPPAVAPAADAPAVNEQENKSPRGSNPETTSLFQASAYAGMNVDDLFDED